MASTDAAPKTGLETRADKDDQFPGDALLDHLANAESELDFIRLSDDIEDDLLEAGLREYQQYLDELNAAKDHLDGLLTSTATTLGQLSNISASFHVIDTQTRGFQKQSTGILEEQKRNEKYAQEVADNLRYYEPLEGITRRLNAPGAGALVRSKDFSQMLVTLDECLDYMQTHRKHKEADTYRSRYRLLLTRALTLVRNTFTGAVRDITAEVASRIADKQLNDTTMSALLYSKFRVGAAEMKELSLEIQKRAGPTISEGSANDPGTEGEYVSLMNELHSSFAASRGRLLLPLVNKKLADISQAPSSRDLLGFARTSIGYIRGVCMDEFELWGEWFWGQTGLYDLLESICEPLYGYLRPRIIYETKISRLCQLVTLIQTRYSHDPEDDALESSLPDPNEFDFADLIQPALEDAQTRLVFRALAVLRDEIENYKPKPEDIDYPRRMTQTPTTAVSKAPLSGRRQSKDPTMPLPKDPEIVDEDSGDDQRGSYSWTAGGLRHAALQNCYPTLPRAVKLLSRIYRLVNSSVFDDLAHQIVHQTTMSLHTAATHISSKSTPADAQLFLLRHMLLLKSQIVAFDIEFVTPDVSFDFSGMTNTFYELRDRGGLFNPRSWLKLVGGGLLPRVVENMLDAKVELDGRLRSVINDFCAGYATDMTKSLPKPGAQLKKNSSVEDAVLACRRHVEKEAPILRAKLEQYLDDHRTKETLVAAVEEQVVQIYEAFFEAYVDQKGQKHGISRKGKGREDELWDVDTFAEWAESVFNVALSYGGDDADGSGSRSLSRSRSS